MKRQLYAQNNAMETENQTRHAKKAAKLLREAADTLLTCFSCADISLNVSGIIGKALIEVEKAGHDK